MKIQAKELQPGQVMLIPTPGWLFNRTEEEVDVSVVVAKSEPYSYGSVRVWSTLGNTYVFDPEQEVKVQP